MNHQIVKIYNTNDFERTTKGIKVAQFMRLKSSSSDSDKIIKNFEDLVISNSLCCSYCNTVFADKYQQRSHYKLDWHRFNLKQHLYGLKSVSEDIFKVIIDKNDLSTSDSEENIQSEDCISQQWNKNKKIKKKTVNRNLLEHKLDSSDNDCTQEHDVINKNDILLSIGTRHSKVFFENEEGNIFSIYRCLLHNKKIINSVKILDSEDTQKDQSIARKRSIEIFIQGSTITLVKISALFIFCLFSMFTFLKKLHIKEH